MNPEIKQKWIDALESGEYQQARGCLRNNHAYCCLGVLTDLYAKEKGITFEEVGSRHDQGTYLAPVVQEWSGVSYNGRLDIPVQSHNLSDYNDSGVAFPEIAGLIRTHL